MKKLLLLFTSLTILGQLSAQNPCKELGIKGNEMEYLTLSDGRYDEFHGYKDYERVGSAIIDMRTNKIVRFIDKDSIPDENFYAMDMTTRFLTIDPLAEMYSEMSPYGYCANNPIRFIDPDGMSIDNYSVNDKGEVNLLNTTTDKYDVLYAVDSKGKKLDTNNDKKVTEEDGQRVNDTSILPNLSKKKEVSLGSVSKASTGKKGADDIINVFKYATKNTSAEWRIDRFSGKGGDNFMVSTLHRSDYSPSSSNLGLDESSIRVFMHSHPDEPNNIGSEKYSMGDDGITKGPFLGGTDYANSINRFYNNNNKEPYPSYNYFPVSGRKYYVGPYGIKVVKGTISKLVKGN